MRGLALLLGVLSATAVSQAGAQVSINYDTYAGWDGLTPTHAATLLHSGISLTFNGLSNASATALPGTGSHVSFGTIDLSVPFGTPLTDLGTHTFTLQLIQHLNTPGSGNFLGTLTGTVNATASNAVIDFSQAMFTIGGVTYEIQDPTLIVSPNTNNGTTTLQGHAIATAPEPASVALLATGLVGLVGVGLRRRRV